MRFTYPLLAACVFALVAGTASANDSEGLTGADWDDSHMRSRHLPSVEAAPPATVKTSAAVAPDGTRTLPTSEYRSWESGPVAPAASKTRRAKGSVRDSRVLEKARSQGRQAKPRSNARTSSSRGARARR